MRILFVTRVETDPFGFTASAQSVHHLCRLLADQGHEPVLLSGASRSGGKGGLTRDSGPGYLVFRAPDPGKHVEALALSVDPAVAIILGNDVQGLVAQVSELDLPTLAWVHDCPLSGLCDHVFDSRVLFAATSAFEQDRIRVLMGRDAPILPPFHPHGVDGTATENRKLAIFFNPVASRGIHLVFKLARKHKNRRFLFIEQDDPDDEWRQYCHQQSMLCGNIEWRREVSMNNIMINARVLLVPDVNPKGHAFEAVEALRRGIPVLASNLGVLPASVGETSECLAPYESIEKWDQQFTRLWDLSVDLEYQAACCEQGHSQLRQPSENLSSFLETVGELKRNWATRYY